MKIKILKEAGPIGTLPLHKKAGPSVKKTKQPSVNWDDFGEEDKWLHRTGYPAHKRLFMVKKHGVELTNNNMPTPRNKWSVEEVAEIMLQYEKDGGDIKQIKMTSDDTKYPYTDAWYYAGIKEVLRELTIGKNAKYYLGIDGKNLGLKTVDQIVASINENPGVKHVVWQSGWEDGWLDAFEVPAIKKALGHFGDTPGKPKPTTKKVDIDYKVWHLKTDFTPAHGEVLDYNKKPHLSDPLITGPRPVIENGKLKLFSAREIAQLMSSSAGGGMVQLNHSFKVKEENNISYSDWSMIQVMRKARADAQAGGKISDPNAEDDQIKQVGGIKIRVGTSGAPCQDFSPESGEKPFGHKQFDPYTKDAMNKGEWECNTEAEHEVLIAIEHFVTMNSKISADVVKDIIDAAKNSSPGEPLHPEDDAPWLYRGSSRETLRGENTTLNAAEILEAIDWSETTNMMKTQENTWYAFKYNGKFVMKFSVASWTEHSTIAAGFAKGGPSLTPQHARPYQFVYRVTPSAAKEVQGTFIDFDELYNLESNHRARKNASSLPNFQGIGGYKDFDEETLLLGTEGAGMSVPEIFVNWDFLTSKESMRNMKKELPDVYASINKLMNKDRPEVSREDIEAFWGVFQKDHMFQLGELEEYWNNNFEDMKNYIEPIKSNKHQLMAKQQFYKNLIEKWPNSWFDNFLGDVTKLLGQWRKVARKRMFEHDSVIWNEHPRHPWYQLKYEEFISKEKQHIIDHAMTKLETMGMEAQRTKAYISKMRRTMSPRSITQTTNVLEERKPWYKRWAAVEKKKGMRARLLRKGGNKFVAAKGMKNVKKTPKSKSPPPGAGVLEESDEGLYKDESMALPYISNYLNASWLWKENWPNEMYNQWERLYNAYYPRSGEKDPLIIEEEISIMLKMLLDKDKVEKYLTDRGQTEIPKLEKILLTLFSK